jgi:hypothetical protein
MDLYAIIIANAVCDLVLYWCWITSIEDRVKSLENQAAKR